jgi:hypothetical protein
VYIQRLELMIWESHYWKEDLARLANYLQKKAQQRQWPERSLAKLEKQVFIGFYAIRRLIEAKKLSAREVSRVIPVVSFRSTGRQRITLLNWNTKFAEAFDFEDPRTVRLSVTFLCNQVIHSSIYKEVFDERGLLTGIFISSDRDRNRKLYFIALTELIKIFSKISKDYPSNAEYDFDPTVNDYIVRTW